MPTDMNRPNPLPPAETLNALFAYDPETGILTNRVRRANRMPGAPVPPDVIRISSLAYRTSRVIWRMVTGEDPGNREVDHKNHDRMDNRWENLRLATHRQNTINRRPFRKNPEGVKGAYLVGDRCNGKSVYIGRFATRTEAVEAYRARVTAEHGDFGHHPDGRPDPFA